MACYLGIDIGTRESKGVLVDHQGKILAMLLDTMWIIPGRGGFLRMRIQSGGETFVASLIG